MLYLPYADANDNIEVMNASDSHKLYSIPDGKRVIVEFIGSLQPIGKSGGKWRHMTGKMARTSAYV
jgi:hypothetical protein